MKKNCYWWIMIVNNFFRHLISHFQIFKLKLIKSTFLTSFLFYHTGKFLNRWKGRMVAHVQSLQSSTNCGSGLFAICKNNLWCTNSQFYNDDWTSFKIFFHSVYRFPWLYSIHMCPTNNLARTLVSYSGWELFRSDLKARTFWIKNSYDPN